MAQVDLITDRLAHEVGRDCPDLEAVLGQQIVATLAVRCGVLTNRLSHAEVVPPTGQFQSVVAPRGRHLGQLLEGQVRPLPREQRDRINSCLLQRPILLIHVVGLPPYFLWYPS